MEESNSQKYEFLLGGLIYNLKATISLPNSVNQKTTKSEQKKISHKFNDSDKISQKKAKKQTKSRQMKNTFIAFAPPVCAS